MAQVCPSARFAGVLGNEYDMSGDRLIPAASLLQSACVVLKELDRVWLEPASLMQEGNRLFRLVLGHQCCAEVVEGVNVLWIQLQSFPECADGFVCSAEAEKCGAQAVLGLSEIFVNFDGLSIGSDGFFEFLFMKEC